MSSVLDSVDAVAAAIHNEWRTFRPMRQSHLPPSEIIRAVYDRVAQEVCPSPFVVTTTVEPRAERAFKITAIVRGPDPSLSAEEAHFAKPAEAGVAFTLPWSDVLSQARSAFSAAAVRARHDATPAWKRSLGLDS